MTRIRCLATCVGLVLLTQGAAMAQVRSSLDAPGGTDHEYVVAVWFDKQDKAGTFKSRIMDRSIPGDYDRRFWEDAKLKWNDPNGSGVMRIFPVRTWASMGATDRQQVEQRIQQERNRIEFIDKPTVDVKPIREEKKVEKKDQGKTTYGYDPNAKKSASFTNLAGTRWIMNNGSNTCNFNFGGDNTFTVDVRYSNGNSFTLEGQNNTWRQSGQSVSINYGGANSTMEGTIKGDVMEGKGKQNDGSTFDWRMKKTSQ